MKYLPATPELPDVLLPFCRVNPLAAGTRCGQSVRMAGSHRMVVAGLAIAAVVLAGGVAVLVASDGDSEDVARSPSTTGDAAALDLNPALTSPTIPSGQERLSTASRLSHEGIGPVKLGMTLAEASGSGGLSVTARFLACPAGAAIPAIALLDPEIPGLSIGLTSDLRIAYISVVNPAIATTRGIHVGSTSDDVLRAYPDATRRSGFNFNTPLVVDGSANLLAFYDGTGRFATNPGVVAGMHIEPGPDLDLLPCTD